MGPERTEQELVTGAVIKITVWFPMAVKQMVAEYTVLIIQNSYVQNQVTAAQT